MKNAHERFGELVYVRRTERASTNVSVHVDAFVGEERGKAHFVSVIGGDVELGAIAAAFSNGEMFTVVDPTLVESIVSLGDKPLLFRGSIIIAGRKRPLRHLVACSQELADASSDGKLLLVSSNDTFIWSSLVSHYGLPATPEWGSWILDACGIALAKTHSPSPRIRMRRSCGRGNPETAVGAAFSRTKAQKTALSIPEWRSRVADDSTLEAYISRSVAIPNVKVRFTYDICNCLQYAFNFAASS